MGDRIFIELQMDAFVSLLGAPRIRTSDGKVSIPYGRLVCNPHREIIPDAFGEHQNPMSLPSGKRFDLPFLFYLGPGSDSR